MNYNNIKRFYRSLYFKNGRSTKTVGWPSKKEQNKRFQALIKNFDQSLLKEKSIVDFGCGLAHFLSWLKERGLERNYIGVDIIEEFLIDNRKRYSDFDFFSTQNFLQTTKKYGFITASGVFTLSWGTGHKKKVKKMIKTLYQNCQYGFSFNMLNKFYPKKKSNYYYFNPFKIGRFCNSLTKKLIIDCSYLPTDFTVTLLKKNLDM